MLKKLMQVKDLLITQRAQVNIHTGLGGKAAPNTGTELNWTVDLGGGGVGKKRDKEKSDLYAYVSVFCSRFVSRSSDVHFFSQACL